MKKLIILIGLLFLVFGSSTCTKPPDNSAEISSPTTPKQSSSLATSSTSISSPSQQRKRQRVAHGLGMRRWEKGTAIILNDKEKASFALTTYVATFQKIQETLPALGKVMAHPLRQAIVSYPFSARIAAIHVSQGDWVKKGDPLVTLYSQTVGEARSAYYKAIADYELAKVNYEREKNLFDKGVGAKKNLLAAEAQLKVAQSNLEEAEKKLHVLGFNEKQVKEMAQSHQISPSITLFAPISGKIATSQAILGAMVSESTEIMTILDPRLLCIDAEVFEKDIAKIRLGQEVKVTVPAYPNKIFKGKIAYISDFLNEETRTIKVRTAIPNPDYLLKPGMLANIEIILNHQEKALVVPKEAILDEGNEHIVFVEKNGKYFPRVIKTGFQHNGLVQITDGLKAGEKVVVNGNFALKSKLYEDILEKEHVH